MNAQDLQNIIYNSIKKITDSEISKLSYPRVIVGRITAIGDYKNYYKFNYQGYNEHIGFLINGNESLVIGDMVYILYSQDNNFDNLIMGKYYTSTKGSNIDNFIDLLYPIGSVIINGDINFNPNVLYTGTTWQRIKGKIVVGVDENDTDFSSSGKTGGTKTVTITTEQMPSHTHIQDSHSHTLNNHTHTLGPHAHGLNNHTHSISSHTHSMAHTHSVGAHSHGLNSHTHAVGTLAIGKASLTGYARLRDINFSDSNLVLSTNGICSYQQVAWSGSHWGMSGTNLSNYQQQQLNIDASHTHTLSGATAAASGNTANSTAFNTGAASATATGGTSLTTAGASGSTANSPNITTTGPSTNSTSAATAVNQSTGGGQSHNNLQPYITKYIWERIS